MTNNRPYRDALPVATALNEIEGEAGRQFDPAVVGQFSVLVVEEAA
jgi:Response regulator containing a CheY-like receiver domain and an HD-GYP domain